MKKNYFRLRAVFLGLMFLAISAVATAQVSLPHYESFNYNAGDSLPQHGWTGLNSGDQIAITSGSLSYGGLAASEGNKVAFNGLGRDFIKTFTSTTTGTIYYSFIMQVTSLGSLDATGGYFSGLAANSTTFGGSIWTKLNGSDFNVGINPRTTAANCVWSTNAFAINTPIFVVVSYEFVTGTGNDVVKMWINPTDFGGATPAVQYTATNTGGTDLTAIDRVFLRQDSDTETPFIEMDEIRIGTSWADVTQAGGSSILVTDITLNGAGGASTIDVDNGTLQINASILPVDATNQSVTWSVINGTGAATISGSGLLTAVSDGDVTVRATANDGSGVYGEMNVNISNQGGGSTVAFYDGFAGTGTLGGNCADASCNENGWYTHSNTNAATIDIVAGSLSYTGLQASIGNKAYISGNTVTLKRDINAALTITGDVAYYSALIEIVDNTNLGDTGFEYFMHFAQGAGNTATGFFAKIGVKKSGTGFRFGLSGNSTGNTFTEVATDYTFGTTYLVVVKYDMSTTTATLWVNPATLGSSEPSSSATNNTGTTVPTAFGSVCIRNGYTAPNGTPKAHIDEVRVGTTFAEVTPVYTATENTIGNNSLQVYPNPTKGIININAGNENIHEISVYSICGNLVYSNVSNNAMQTIDLSNVNKGLYLIKIVDQKTGKQSTRKIQIQ